MQKSKILKTLVWGNTVSLAVLDTTALVNEVISRHRLSAVAAAALGRTMTATAYLCSWLKGESVLSVTVDGKGAGGKICVSGDGELRLRGFIENPEVELPPRADGKLDVGGCVGKNGTVTVVRDEGYGLPFTGTCPLVSGEIAEDFSAYFLTSEQRPTAIALGVLIGKDGTCLGAGGVFLQPLPEADEDVVSRIEREIGGFRNLSALIAEDGAESVLKRIENAPYEEREITFRCTCSREKIGELILSLGKKEAKQIVKERGKLSVHCHVCNTDYEFDAGAVEELFAAHGGEEV